MCPRFGRVNSERTFVGHVLALETEHAGVILVDTGIGASARTDPNRVLGRGFTTMWPVPTWTPIGRPTASWSVSDWQMRSVT